MSLGRRPFGHAASGRIGANAFQTPQVFARRVSQVRTLHHVAPLQSGRLQELERPVQDKGKQTEYSNRTEAPVKEGAAEQSHRGSGKFNWLKAWYPVAIERDLPVDRPTSIRLLGNAVVLWKDGDNQWRAFKDLCPHRLVPLSEGRVENGNLLCSYHSWEFKGDGKLHNIPQADNQPSLETARKSQRSCCAVHPCRALDGLIWVYGSCEPGAEEEASKQSMEGLRLPQFENAITIPWFMRDLPYSADTLMENVLDPSHVPHSHHGVQGNRFELKKMHIKAGRPLNPDDGFSVTAYEPEDTPADQHSPAYPYDLSYTPPTLVRYLWNNGNVLATHCIPTDPGRSRILFAGSFKRDPPKGVAGLVMKLLFSKWGLWIDHFTRNEVLDGDGPFLCYQSLLNIEKGADKGEFDVSKSYYMPASLDSGVSTLRKWLATFAEGFPWGPGALDPQPLATQPRSELLNRYDQHVKHCPSCAGAYEVFKKLRWVGAAITIVALSWASYSLGNGAGLKRMIGPVILTVLAALLAWQSQSMIPKFTFKDYRHPDH